MALTPMAIRRNQPNVHARDSCAAGITSSAILRPGEKKETPQAGIVDSLVLAHASARNPTNEPAAAGKTSRKKMRCGMRMDSIKPPGNRRS